MSKVIRYLPELEGDEQVYVATLLKNLTDEQAEQFAHVYRSRRRDANTTLILALLGFVVVAGIHRFYLGQIGMGLLYLFTGGLCLIGTIVDLFNYKRLTFEYNRKQADEVVRLIQGAFPTDPGRLTA
ncbi:MAG: membrane protein [Rhodothermaceae bacterium]|nr:MAG: membrane protein [Rhodothermaceae bacterium]